MDGVRKICTLAQQGKVMAAEIEPKLPIYCDTRFVLRNSSA
jgi:hypothetical protein